MTGRGADATLVAVRIPSWLVAPAAAQGLVIAAAGIVLFFAPTLGHDLWGWELTPFNTRFLGGIYLAALVPFVALVAERRWDLARVIVPMDFVFMSLILVVSLVYAGHFMWERPVTWAWFAIFVSVPVYTAYFLTRLRGAPQSAARPWTTRTQVLLIGSALLLVGYGIGMLAAPRTLLGFWPWPVDGFHGRVYSAIFLSLGLAAAILAREPAPAALVALGLTCVALAVVQPLGLFVVDVDVDKVDWSSSGTAAWLALFAALFVYGFALTAAGLRRYRRPQW